MATYTSYLNLEKPTTSETFNLLKMNANWDKIDNGVSALNSNLRIQNILITSMHENLEGTIRVLKTGKVVTIASDLHVKSTLSAGETLFATPFMPVYTGESCIQVGLILSNTAHSRVEAKSTGNIVNSSELASGFYKIFMTYIAAE